MDALEQKGLKVMQTVSYLDTQNKAPVALPAPHPQPQDTAFNSQCLLTLEALGRVKPEPA